MTEILVETRLAASLWMDNEVQMGSLMERPRVRSIVLALVVLAAAWGAYGHCVRIEAWLWHLRHGTSINVGNHVVPVPANWYVESQEGGGQLLVRIDTSDQMPSKKLKAHASILLFPENPLNDLDLARLTSLDLMSLKKDGVEPVLRRTFNAGGGTISCAGGDEPRSRGMYDVDPLRWHCKSSTGLWITVGSTDADLGQVWEIVSGIRKKS